MPVITNVNELQDINNDLAGYYWLANDIDALATVGWNGGAGFIPLGNAGTSFTGKFYAGNHIVSNLFINRPATNYVGLFGLVDTPAEISRVTLINANITGNNQVGGLCGNMGGIVLSYCGVTGSITGTNDSVGGLVGIGGGSLLGCFSTATVGGDAQVGGLIGSVSGQISKCHATGNITAVHNYVGGLVGRTYAGTISQCYAIGNVVSTFPSDYVGGLIGYVNSGGDIMTISNCFAKGNATGDDRIGGLIGRLANTADIIDNCYSIGIPSGDTDVGGLCGLNAGTITNCFWDTQTSGTAVSAGGIGKTTSQMKTKSTFVDAGWDFTIIWAIGIPNDGYPFFWAMPPGGLPALPDSPRTTVAVEDKISLEMIRNVEMAARGRAFVDEDGNFVYKSRYARNP